ncbi:hypothetical protein [Legionella micdadei]|uniref:Uncharacterized protein n=1 Tax=Legionella micdadei TaxID=451 RepID=A0A098GDQ6_LEGMI|nr:hypothetical protein [Legionella micdadei]ARG96368.1 hypothetical protein B6N58_00970 [Legionella micdadei]KTD29547.1 putative secreted esterase [Legionella micdadei]CEG59571.1 membrane protein of unknown function [Legionella micdadei]SCX94025.1 hypothetical protein SAMN02982997_00439 [Legionella micdadei]
MKLRKMKFKKIPYYLLLSLLTFGASLIIGFLSFTGMFTIVPLLSLAIGSFVLSVAYEGEIYLQNIKGALNKLLFKQDYLKHYLANDYLLQQFTCDPPIINTNAEDCPQFFKDYEAQLRLLSKFTHKRLDKESRKRKKQIEKALRDMEKWFALQLFSSDEENLTLYENELRNWLKDHGQEEAKALLKNRQTTFTAVKVFSTLAGIFMSLGTTYLLVEAFAALPFLAAIPFATLPAIIVPMAILAGAAYTFLIYNAVTDMINNDSLRKWYRNIRDDLKKGVTPRNVFMAVSAIVLLTLTAALTVCTAGTWWTVAKHTRPLFSWMSKIPNLIASGIAIITGTAQLIFNLQNTSESLELIDNATKMEESVWSKISKAFSKGFKALVQNENWLQLVNLPRLFLMATFLPLRLILFIGHLVSMAVSSDRVPGIPEIISAVLGFTSEFFEDLHYFLGDLFHSHKHSHDSQDLIKERLGQGHGHDHSADIPTRALKFLFTPVFAAAAGWDWLATRIIKTPRQECGLLQMNADPTQTAFEELPLQGRSAAIVYNDTLYYADQRKQTVKKIKSTNIDGIEQLKRVARDEYRTANDSELDVIFALTGRHGQTQLSWTEAWNRQTGKPSEKSVTVKANAKQPSDAWKVEHSMFRINRYIDKHLSKATLDPHAHAPEKIHGLEGLRDAIRNMEEPMEDKIKARIGQEVQKDIYNKHRHDYPFFRQTGNTRTQDFLEEDLPQRISASPAA